MYQVPCLIRSMIFSFLPLKKRRPDFQCKCVLSFAILKLLFFSKRDFTLQKKYLASNNISLLQKPTFWCIYVVFASSRFFATKKARRKSALALTFSQERSETPRAPGLLVRSARASKFTIHENQDGTGKMVPNGGLVRESTAKSPDHSGVGIILH